jgi:hypothetical protein
MLKTVCNDLAKWDLAGKEKTYSSTVIADVAIIVHGKPGTSMGSISSWR